MSSYLCSENFQFFHFFIENNNKNNNNNCNKFIDWSVNDHRTYDRESDERKAWKFQAWRTLETWSLRCRCRAFLFTWMICTHIVLIRSSNTWISWPHIIYTNLFILKSNVLLSWNVCQIYWKGTNCQFLTKRTRRIAHFRFADCKTRLWPKP